MRRLVSIGALLIAIVGATVVAAQAQAYVPALADIMSWDRFDMAKYMTPEDIENWVKEERHKVMYRDESRVD